MPWLEWRLYKNFETESGLFISPLHCVVRLHFSKAQFHAQRNIYAHDAKPLR